MDNVENKEVPSAVVPMDISEVVFYGPHPCARCDKMIVKGGNGAPDDLEFDSPEGGAYPNTVWQRHECAKAPFKKKEKQGEDNKEDNG